MKIILLFLFNTILVFSHDLSITAQKFGMELLKHYKTDEDYIFLKHAIDNLIFSSTIYLEFYKNSENKDHSILNKIQEMVHRIKRYQDKFDFVDEQIIKLKLDNIEDELAHIIIDKIEDD